MQLMANPKINSSWKPANRAPKSAENNAADPLQQYMIVRHAIASGPLEPRMVSSSQAHASWGVSPSEDKPQQLTMDHQIATTVSSTRRRTSTCRDVLVAGIDQ
jgi:hypothetical protein